VLGDIKVHHFEGGFSTDASYETVTLGGEIGWRYFIWKGFNVALSGAIGQTCGRAEKRCDLQEPEREAFACMSPRTQGASGLFAKRSGGLGVWALIPDRPITPAGVLRTLGASPSVSCPSSALYAR